MIALTLPFASKAIAGACISIMGTIGVYTALTSSGNAKTINDVFAACGLCNKGPNNKPVPWKVVKVSKTNHGERVVMRFPFGKTLKDVTRQADALNTAFGVDVAFTRDGSLLILDIPHHPLPSYISYNDKLLELCRGNWRIPVGQSVTEWVLHDFDERPHLLIAGLTRGGKSEFLKVIISTLFQCHNPMEVEFIGVDLKPCALEFRKFYGLWNELAENPEEFLSVIEDAEEDMKQRAAVLAGAGCSNVKQYERVTGKRFKRRFIIVDEYGKSFGSECEKEISTGMMQLTAMGAGLGVHIILCTQRPDAEVIDGRIRANIGSIICMQVASPVQSRVVLGHEGAEDLPEIPGRAIYHAFGHETFVQAPYISDKRLSKILPHNTSPITTPLTVRSDKRGLHGRNTVLARPADVVRLYDE